MTDTETIMNLLNEYFCGDHMRIDRWLKAKNPMLGNTSPFEMVKMGRADKLLAFVQNAKEEGNWGDDGNKT